MNTVTHYDGFSHAKTTDMMGSCTDCKRVTAIHNALVSFGYPSATWDEVSNGYNISFSRKPDASDGIIAMLTYSQLADVGLVEEK